MRQECIVMECERAQHARRMCMMHYQRMRAGTPLRAPNRLEPKGGCQELGCNGAYYARQLCRIHYQRRRNGSLPARIGGEWGPWRTDSRGYVKRNRWVDGKSESQLQHRFIMAQSLGRELSEGETVHHINGNRSDNRIENLQLRQGPHGRGARMICLDCGSHNLAPSAI